jgi:hypothetical protein
LKHNRTKFRIPLVDAAFSYSNNELDSIEPQVEVRDNQAAIDLVQASIDLINNAANVINDNQRLPNMFLIEPTHAELQALIDSGADQNLIDAKQAEYDTLVANENMYVAQMDAIYAGSLTNGVTLGDFQQQIVDLENVSNWILNTKSGKLTRYREGRDRWLYLIGQMIQRDLTPEETAEMESLEANERVLYATGDVYVSMWSDERYSYMYDNYSYLTNHPVGTMPIDVLPGINDINVLPAVLNTSLLPQVGNPGDIIHVLNEGEYAWDPQNQEWSMTFVDRFLADLMSTGRMKRDAFLKAKNELALAMRPTEFAGFYIPAFAITVGGAYETLQA